MDYLSAVLKNVISCCFCNIDCETECCRCYKSSFKVNHQNIDTEGETTCCSGSCRFSQKAHDKPSSPDKEKPLSNSFAKKVTPIINKNEPKTEENKQCRS